MNEYTPYTMTRILARRAFVIAAGVLALPVMLFRADRARFYSYLHRVWMKTSDKPVWLSHAEMATHNLFPSSLTPQLRWLHSLTRITDLSQLIGICSFAVLLQRQ